MRLPFTPEAKEKKYSIQFRNEFNNPISNNVDIDDENNNNNSYNTIDGIGAIILAFTHCFLSSLRIERKKIRFTTIQFG